MTSYTTDNLIDTQLSFISHIIMISSGIGGVCVCTLMVILFLGGEQNTAPAATEARVIQPEPVAVQTTSPQYLTGDDLKKMLYENNLWDIAANDVIAPLVISSFPENLDSLSIDDKKKIFLHTLLPIALTANREIDSERLRLFDILASSGALPGNFKLNAIPAGWEAVLSSEDKAWLTSLEDKYNAHDIKELKKRMRRIPVSLVMAQGALESSWGTSRFAREGNNLFGLRTWGSKGITPEDKDTKSTYLVASYDSLLDSVHAYLLTLNSHRLYSKFRDLRLSTQDPVILSKGLIYYSEKRKEYVSQVNRIIKYNSLKKFDTVQLKQGQPINNLIILSKK
jgi:Bax protein